MTVLLILPMIPKVIDSWDSSSSSGLRHNISLSSATPIYRVQSKNQGFRRQKSGFPLLRFTGFVSIRG